MAKNKNAKDNETKQEKIQVCENGVNNHKNGHIETILLLSSASKIEPNLKRRGGR